MKLHTILVFCVLAVAVAVVTVAGEIEVEAESSSESGELKAENQNTTNSSSRSSRNPRNSTDTDSSEEDKDDKGNTSCLSKTEVEELLKTHTQKIQELERENERLKLDQPSCSRGRHENANRTRKNEPGQCLWFPEASVQIYKCKSFRCKPSWAYNGGRDGHCRNFDDETYSVELTGSCVTLYQDKNCCGPKFRLSTSNRNSGRDITKRFPGKVYGHNSAKSIGPCW